MSFISYAQNYEDVMLWRALKHIENGFYIDVGANDPVIDSVTKSFYDNGWSGINIEPLKIHFDDLVAQRVKDININAAASDRDGLLKIWQSEVRGWATADAEIAVKHEADGYKGEWLDVPSYRLKDICDKYDVKTIHFMKIDVEGFEKTVLSGMDFSIFRPWVMVIEATKPNSQEFNYMEWEGIILSSDYIFAYCDGLNRFYVAAEHSELLAALKYPPNVFDQFTTTDEVNLQQYVNIAQEQAKVAQEQAKVAQEQAKVAQEQAREVQEQLISEQEQMRVAQALAEEFHQRLLAVYASTSWRLTRPIRGIKRVLACDKAFVTQAFGALLKIKIFLRPRLIKAINYINRKPTVALYLKNNLARFPWLKQRLKRVVTNQPLYNNISVAVPTEIKKLTPRAQQIYQELQRAIELRNKGGK